MSHKVTSKRAKFLELVEKELGKVDQINRKQIADLVSKYETEVKWPSWLTADKSLRAGRGVFKLPTLEAPAEKPAEKPAEAESVESESVSE